jgi:hypothetical protein
LKAPKHETADQFMNTFTFSAASLTGFFFAISFPICSRMVRIYLQGNFTPYNKTPGDCPLEGEIKDSFAQLCGNCPVSSEGISISTTSGQKENDHDRRKDAAGDLASK